MTDFIAYPSCQSREVITLCRVLRRSQGKPNREMETSLRREGELYPYSASYRKFYGKCKQKFILLLFTLPPALGTKENIVWFPVQCQWKMF